MSPSHNSTGECCGTFYPPATAGIQRPRRPSMRKQKHKRGHSTFPDELVLNSLKLIGDCVWRDSNFVLSAAVWILQIADPLGSMRNSVLCCWKTSAAGITPNQSFWCRRSVTRKMVFLRAVLACAENEGDWERTGASVTAGCSGLVAVVATLYELVGAANVPVGTGRSMRKRG